MALPRLIEAFRTPACFTLEEAAEARDKPRSSVLNEVKYLQKAGYIRSVRRGLYVFDPNRTGERADRFVVASKVTDPYAFGYHSALELHGVARSALFDHVYVASPHDFAHFSYENARVRRVKTDAILLEEGTAELKRSGQSLQVAGRELALIQCVDRLEYAGGLEEALDSIEGFPYLQWDLLEELLDLHGRKTLYRRVGFVLEAHRDRFDPPELLLDSLEEKGTGQPVYFGTTPEQGGTLVPRWDLLVPARFAEVNQDR